MQSRVRTREGREYGDDFRDGKTHIDLYKLTMPEPGMPTIYYVFVKVQEAEVDEASCGVGLLKSVLDRGLRLMTAAD